ncbi:MAG: Crp/Fnr family transcriptional regulator [Sulfuricaulis sp.]|uniref:Crp/Fnr family transcriptional regulator n=1 Tax=Sulfuricaulis sp. TaxID=2003553 RepID=UPI003C43E118
MNHRILNSCQVRPTWLGRSDCRSCKIFKEVLFSDLSKKELETIIQGIYEPIDEFNYAEGAVIYEEGYEDNAIYTIRDGLVKLVRHQSDGEGRIIRLMKTADTIGLERLLGRPYGHTAIALQPVTACRIPIGVLRQLGEEKPRFYRKLMERWANALFQADDYIMMLLSGTVKQRVVQLICWLGEIDHAHKSRVVMLNGRDIAAILDITPESVSRILAELKRQNILRPRTDGYYEYDAKALKEYSAAA